MDSTKKSITLIALIGLLSYRIIKDDTDCFTLVEKDKYSEQVDDDSLTNVVDTAFQLAQLMVTRETGLTPSELKAQYIRTKYEQRIIQNIIQTQD